MHLWRAGFGIFDAGVTVVILCVSTFGATVLFIHCSMLKVNDSSPHVLSDYARYVAPFCVLHLDIWKLCLRFKGIVFKLITSVCLSF